MASVLLYIAVFFALLFFDITISPEKYLKFKEKFTNSKKDKDL